MLGAPGLLSFITSGTDLTLDELDVAAIRISEEVDPDANIIVGATFDESLDGIIRVSVVATGVDVNATDHARPPATQSIPGAHARSLTAPPPRSPSLPASSSEVTSTEHHESRIAELAQRLKADNARIADRIERAEQHASRPVASHSAPPPVQSAASVPSAALRPSIDQAATAAVAAALAPHGEEVSIRPMPSKPSLFPESSGNEAPPAAEPALPKAFIPPPPERPMSRGAPRMPTFEELPVPGQNEFRARRGEPIDTEHPEKRRLTLLQRLAAVGLGRREDELEHKSDSRPVEPARAAAPERTSFRGSARPSESRGPDSASEFAKRGGPKGFDIHGRTAPAHPQPEEDQLDIPAFLRRQANLNR
jgi:cell division protein FtsZ